MFGAVCSTIVALPLLLVVPVAAAPVVVGDVSFVDAEFVALADFCCCCFGDVTQLEFFSLSASEVVEMVT